MGSYSFVIAGRPIPKGRPRLGRKGRVFTPATTQAFEAAVREAYDGPLFEGPVAIELTFHTDHTQVTIREELYGSPLRGDIDNYIKSVMDGLQNVAYKNDRQVMRLDAVKA